MCTTTLVKSKNKDHYDRLLVTTDEAESPLLLNCFPQDATQGFVPYKIDFTALKKGKILPMSKHKAIWRLGFSDLNALAVGKTGHFCCGEDYEVVLTWSVISGKRKISVNGQEVYYSTSGKFERRMSIRWIMAGSHTAEIVAYASPSFKSRGERQYNLIVDGRSYFNMPTSNELGLTKGGGARIENKELFMVSQSEAITENRDSLRNNYQWSLSPTSSAVNAFPKISPKSVHPTLLQKSPHQSSSLEVVLQRLDSEDDTLTITSSDSTLFSLPALPSNTTAAPSYDDIMSAF